MKKQFFSTMKVLGLALLAMASLVTSCENPEEGMVDGKRVISLTASIEGYTKATDTSFEKDDAVGVHIITDKVFVNNAKFTYTKGGKLYNKNTYFWYNDTSVTADLVAYYPFDYYNGAYSDKGYTFTVNADQSTDKKYKESDFMVANTTSKPTTKAVNLPFRHTLSKVVLSVDPKGETVEEIVVSGVSTSATINLKEGTSVAESTKGTIIPAKVTIDKKDAWAFITVPQSGVDMKVEVSTASGNHYTFTDVAATLAAGKSHTATLALTDPDKEVQFTTTIADWVAENEGTMEFERVENDIIIQDDCSIDDVDPTLDWPLIATLPSLISPDMTTDCVVVVNVSESSVTPGEKLYAHTGVITDQSTSGGDWKYVKHDWAVDAEDCRLTHVGGTIYALLIPGGPRAFYGVPEGEELKQLAFVFRTSGGTAEVKNNGQDIYVDLVDASELLVKFVSPSHGEIVGVGDVVSVKAVAQNAEGITLMLNDAEVAQVTGNEINYEYTVSEIGDLVFEAVAHDKEGATATSSVTVAALGATESMARPAGVKDGVTVEGSEATVVIFAPGKEQVILLGDFNGFAPSNEYMMYKDGDYFWTTVSGLQPNTEYAYQFLVDGKTRVGDPYCEKVLDPWNDKWINENYEIYPNLKAYPANTTGMASVFTTSTDEYKWEIENFVRPDKNSLAIYELLFRDFTPEGSVKAATAKLDYLEALGVNAIELMPIQEFDGNNSWGYNPCFYFAPDKAYGTEEDYKEFIDECHKRGIAVILDIVLNHATGQFPWMLMWSDDGAYPNSQNPFFNVKAKHPFNVYNDLNHNFHKTKSYFCDMLKYWLTEYKVDGYRFDLAKGITQTDSGSDDGRCQQYDSNRIGHLKAYYDAMQQASPGSYMILEYFVCDQEETEMANYGALPWRNSIHGYQESVMGWTGSSNFSGAYAKGRVSYMESHDEDRIAYKAVAFGNTGAKDWANLHKRIAGAMALHFLTPYPKMMWQGGELGDDRELTEAGRTDKKPFRWEDMNNPNRKALYDACCKIISFRTDHPELYGNGASNSTTKYQVSDGDMGGKHLVYTSGGSTVAVVANFNATGGTTTKFALTLPAGTYTNLITGASVNVSSGTYNVSLAPHDYIVLVKTNK